MHKPTAAQIILIATSVVVVAVAAFAAAVSYSHIFDLGRHYGQTCTDARLLPLSVDGLIVAASLVQLHAVRTGRDAHALARWMLWLGVAATVSANIAYGAKCGPVGATVSAWPAASFIGSVEMLMLMIKSGCTQATATEPAAELVTVTAPKRPRAVPQRTCGACHTPQPLTAFRSWKTKGVVSRSRTCLACEAAFKAGAISVPAPSARPLVVAS